LQTLQVEILLANLLSMQEALQFQLLHHLISAKSHKLVGEQSGTIKKLIKICADMQNRAIIRLCTSNHCIFLRRHFILYIVIWPVIHQFMRWLKASFKPANIIWQQFVGESAEYIICDESNESNSWNDNCWSTNIKIRVIKNILGLLEQLHQRSWHPKPLGQTQHLFLGSYVDLDINACMNQ
jgi:hypothetical protein